MIVPSIQAPYPDPDGAPIVPLPPELDLDKHGLGVVESGVRQLVSTLKDLGYKTVCSCAGHTGGLEPYPWLVFLVENEVDEKQLLRLIVALGRFNKSQGKNGNMPMAKDLWIISPIQQEIPTIHLQPADLNPGRNLKRISVLRRQSEKLASFLRDQCADLY
jgi:hypothetical protein